MANNWTRDQLFLALRLYFETPFGRLHQGNPEIIALAARIDRTSSAVAMKLSNFASIDPEIVKSGRKGLSGASVADRSAWSEFTSDWTTAVEATESAPQPPISETEIETLQKRRVGQEFFRRAVLGNFNNHCCATGIAIPRLLVASHIVPWADDRYNRLNPANGLCLAATHDKAFDAGLITLDNDFRWEISRDLLVGANLATQSLFRPLAGQQIRPPANISLSADLVRQHRERARQQCHYA
ncbi:HNH endonuclease [Sandarakinorhabdus sp. AAP62]|uniref:HNH endonuclease n=1 Tax=Sandarakinorhabdus sp. AAP62 TaxID=1248916 RepID=UPI00037877EF|nr:HNH endonuclease [Sandarakinorhabdus sp. AAP62]